MLLSLDFWKNLSTFAEIIIEVLEVNSPYPVVRLVLFFVITMLLPISAAADAYDIDSIDRLYVTNVSLAHSRIDSLKRRCEKNGYKDCSRSRMEVVYTFISEYEHRPARMISHAQEAYKQAVIEKCYENQLTALQMMIEGELELGFNKIAVYHINLMRAVANKAPKKSADYFIPTSLKYLAMAYFTPKDIGKSIALLDEAIRCSKNIKAEYILYYEITFEKGIRYMNVKDYRMAERTYREILRRLDTDSAHRRGGIDKAGYDINYLITYSQLAIVESYLNHPHEAEIACARAKKLYSKYPGVPDINNRIAKYLSMTHRYDELDKFVEPLIKPEVMSNQMAELMQLLLQSYIVNGKTAKAKKLYGIYLQLEDTIRVRNSDCALEEMNIAYNTYALNNKIKSQKIFLAAVIVITFFLVSVIVVSFFYLRNLRRLYKSARERIDDFMEKQKKTVLASEKRNGQSEEEILQQFYALDERIKEEKPYLDSLFGRDDLATFAKVDKNRLTEIVKAGVNITPYKYLNQLRVAHAVELLKSKPDYSIETIADESGFGNRTTFYRVFIDVFNITPVQYRRMLK